MYHFNFSMKKIFFALFLLGLFFLSGQTFAQDATTITIPKDTLVLSADPVVIAKNQPTKITATFDATKKEKGEEYEILFFNNKEREGYKFSPETCKIIADLEKKAQSCFVTFTSSNEGSFDIFALLKINSKIFPNKSKGVSIKVDGRPYISDAEVPLNTKTTYTPLAPLPGFDKEINTAQECDANGENCTCPFGNYLNTMIKLVIGFSAVLAMVMIVMGGIEYMTSELVSSKEAGKETITNAILGLVIALGAYLILNTLNPDLLKSCLVDSLPDVEIMIEEDVPQTPINGKYCTKTTGAGDGYSEKAIWSTITNVSKPEDSVKKLKKGIVTSKGECLLVGEKNCTSTFGLDTSYVDTILAKCPDCKPITITGGTECWLHGGAKQKTNHRPGSPVVDLRLETKLDAYIKSGVKNGSWYEKDNIFYLLEPDHWHVGK